MNIGINITFWEPDTVAGLQTMIINILTTFNKLNNKNYNFIIFSSKEASNYLKDHCNNLKIVTIRVKADNPLKRLIVENLILNYYIYKYKIHILHTFNYYGPILSLCKTIINVLDMNYIAYPQNFNGLNLYFRKILTFICAKKAIAIMTISAFSKREIIKYLGNRSKIFPIYLSHNFQINYSPMTNNISFSVTPNDYFFSLGSSHPHKNFPGLVDAYERYFRIAERKGFKPKKLIVAGLPKKGQGVLYNKVNNSPVSSYIECIGYVSIEDLIYLYKNACCFVFPSLYEGFGIPPLEAMKIGCPVISSNAGSLTEVVGNAALLVDPKNCDEIANNLILMHQEAIRKKYISLGFERIKLFSWEKTCLQTIQMYDAVKHNV